MKKKKIGMKIIDVIFILYIIIGTIMLIKSSMLEGSLNVDFEAIPPNLTTAQLLKGIANFTLVGLFIFIFFMFIFMIGHIYIVAIYIGFRVGYKKYFLDKLDVTDFNKDEYYRDIIKKYSPAVLSYVEDFNLSNKDVIATLLSLELKGKIRIGNTIEVINHSYDLLESNEQYVLENLINDQLKNINLVTFKEKVIADCINDELLVREDIAKKNSKKSILKILATFLIYTVIFILVFMYCNGKTIDSVLLVIYLFLSFLLIIFFIFAFPIMMISYFITYSSLHTINPYIRTKKAKMLNKKLKGLKNFIRDFSVMEEKRHQEIKIWEEYLIYSVIFNQNDKIVNEISSKI